LALIAGRQAASKPRILSPFSHLKRKIMQLEYQLRTEIEFWRDIIETRPEDTSHEAFERMASAKSLAERKLDLLLNDSAPVLN
jgi:hypothetical protein